MSQLAAGNPPAGLGYLVKSSIFFTVVFRLVNKGVVEADPGWAPGAGGRV